MIFLYTKNRTAIQHQNTTYLTNNKHFNNTTKTIKKNISTTQYLIYLHLKNKILSFYLKPTKTQLLINLSVLFLIVFIQPFFIGLNINFLLVKFEF